jgi:hypothetical protein
MNKLLIFILALFLLGVSSCKNKVKQETPPPPPKVEKKKPASIPPPVVEEVVVEVDEGVSIDHSYFVIVNSYTVPEFANEKSKLWTKNGFKSMVIMRNDDGYYRLALKSYNDYSNAVTSCLELRGQNEEFKDAWVMFRSKKVEYYKHY